MNKSPKNRAHSIILAFGGVNVVASFFNISKFAIYPWIEKDCIPSNRMLVLVQARPELFAHSGEFCNASEVQTEQITMAMLGALHARIDSVERAIANHSHVRNTTSPSAQGVTA